MFIGIQDHERCRYTCFIKKYGFGFRKKINRSPHFREDAKTYSSYRVSINLRLISINIIVVAAKLHFFEDIIKQISHFFDDNIELTLHFFEDKVMHCTSSFK